MNLSKEDIKAIAEEVHKLQGVNEGSRVEFDLDEYMEEELVDAIAIAIGKFAKNNPKELQELRHQIGNAFVYDLADQIKRGGKLDVKRMVLNAVGAAESTRDE